MADRRTTLPMRAATMLANAPRYLNAYRRQQAEDERRREMSEFTGPMPPPFPEEGLGYPVSPLDLVGPGELRMLGQGVKAAWRAAGDVTGTAAERGMFAGIEAKTADKAALKAAESAEAAGASPDDIWRSTGWGRGADNKWRFEIDDSAAAYDPIRAQQELMEMNSKITPDSINRTGFNTEVGGILDHPDLFRAYPEIERKGFLSLPEKKFDRPAMAAYWDGKGVVIKDKYTPLKEEGKLITLHELQHAIQGTENFSKGASNSPSPIMQGVQSSAEVADKYHRSAGEVEARNVQRRMKLTPAERMDIPPWMTEDTPRDKQIVTMLGGKSMSAKPPTDAPLLGFSKGADREMFDRALDLRASQMELPVNARVAPDDRPGVFPTTPEAYTSQMPPQVPTFVPRGTPGKTYPMGDRVRSVIDRKEEIAQALAERSRPFIGTDAQYFYHTYGPTIAAAEKNGVPRQEAIDWLKDFSDYYAATSPRTSTAQNIRNATLSMAKRQFGIKHTDVVGPGTGGMTGEGVGVSEKGFPMMLGEGGIHRKLLDDVEGPTGFNPRTNPKPATFAENSRGNLAGVTADTHAIRAVFDVMNEMQPGSIPEAWIKKEFRQLYKDDPGAFKASSMVDDTLSSQKIDKVANQTEYEPFSDIYHRVGEILNVSPAEAQSLGWFGSGARTGLASELKTIPRLLNERINVTSQLMGMPQEDVMKAMFKKKIPLLSSAPLALLGYPPQKDKR